MPRRIDDRELLPVALVSSPAAVSAPAPYALSCTVPRHLAASATVSPASTKLGSCTAAAPALTFSGTVSDNQAGTVSLVVGPQPLIPVLSTPPAGTSGSAYSFSLFADGGTGTYRWSATGLPPGLSVSTLTSYEAAITGTPAAVTAATTYTVTIAVVDSTGVTATASVKIVINPAAGSGL